jgi:tRNA (cytidine/uridine-2'-O-)-methyltransferase
MLAVFNVVLVAPGNPPQYWECDPSLRQYRVSVAFGEPLGFDFSDAQLRRAGLDYHDMTCVTVHSDWAACRASLGDSRLFALTTKANRRHTSTNSQHPLGSFQPGDAFVFGSESSGLPPALLAEIPTDQRLRLPLIPGNRSLNLSNAVAVMVYEAWRQQGYVGGD